MQEKKKPFYSCEDGIEKSVPRDHRLSYMYHSASNMMPIGDPRDIFSYLTLLMDPYNYSHVSTIPTREKIKAGRTLICDVIVM